MRRQCFFILTFLACMLAQCGMLKARSEVRQHLQTWGDQGNGTYVNPVLNADYSDPDVICVGDRFYMIASDFHFMGMQVLESTDLVNWHLISRIYDRLDYPGWNENQHYAGGSWAPALRYHDGKYWVFFCTPDEGLFMTTATDPKGPWAPLHLVEAVEKWEDPCPFWDEDGRAYLGRSRHGAGPIIVHRMSPDGKQLLDEGVTVYTGPVAEGTKIHKRNGWYYMSIPEGGVSTGWQTVLRARNIYGPYEKKVVLEQGTTDVNGPHQGSLVETPSGEWWFVHFQQYNPLGRVVHLQPMSWREDWPVIGVDQDMNGIGEPVRVWTKPTVQHQSVAPYYPQTSDNFSSDSLGWQWQFNHNPVPEAWSLTKRKGWLALTALPANDFRTARNTLTQKTMGYEGEVTVCLDVSQLASGNLAGLACMGKVNRQIGVQRTSAGTYLYVEDGGREVLRQSVKSKKLWLRLSLNAMTNQYACSYSSDGRTYQAIGTPFAMEFGFWKGVRVGLYCYTTASAPTTGCAYFDDFHYTIKDPVVGHPYQ